MDALRRDLSFALRGLRREPAFTAFCLVTLALGIGANAAMFGIAERLLLAGPDHVKDPGRVVRLYATTQPRGLREFTTAGFGYVSYDLLRQGTQTFSDVATSAINEVILGAGADGQRVKVGVQPMRGRFFTPAEGQEVGFGGPVLLVRSRDGAGAPAAAVRQFLTGVDHTISYVSVETIRARIDPQMRPWKLGAMVFAVSGLLALVVAAIGIYSVTSFLVRNFNWRLHERCTAHEISCSCMRLGVASLAFAFFVFGNLQRTLFLLSCPLDVFFQELSSDLFETGEYLIQFFL